MEGMVGVGNLDVLVGMVMGVTIALFVLKPDESGAAVRETLTRAWTVVNGSYLQVMSRE